MSIYRSLGTVSEVITDLPWPIDFFKPDNLPEFLNKIYIQHYDITIDGDNFSIRFWFAHEDRLTINIPGLNGISLNIGHQNEDGINFFTLILKKEGKTTLTFNNVTLALAISNNLLKPVNIDSATPPLTAVSIDTSGSLTLDESFNVSIDGFNNFELTPAMIANSGIIISADNIKLDLSRTSTPQEILDAGFGDNFLGIYFGEAKVTLPEKYGTFVPSDMVLKKAAIGSGGVSGEIDVEYTDKPKFDIASKKFTGKGSGDLLGIPFGLGKIAIVLKQNSLTQSSLEGQILLPFFDEVLDVDMGFKLDGGFSIKLASASGNEVYSFEKEKLLKMVVHSIGADVKGSLVTFALSGAITPLFGGLHWPTFDVKKFTIDSNGKVTVDGGWIDLPKQLSMDFHGFMLEVSKFGLGTEDNGSKWIGFSGGLKLSAGLPVSGAVEGLRIIWDKNNNINLQFTGVKVAFDIPGSLSFEGHVSFVEDGPKKCFKGGGKLKIIPTNLVINAEIIIGKNAEEPSYTFFYIFVDVELPTGIPLFSTGVSLYGIAGLFAYNMEPGKKPEEVWYDGWYKRSPEGVSGSGKWTDERGSFAFGAGVTLGTAADDGYAVNAKTLFVIVLPGPILMIEGRANFLKDRTDVSGDSAFKALAVLDGRAGNFLLNMEATYPSPQTSAVGKLIKAHAGAEAFFDFHKANNWHLFFGIKDPREKRIRAEVLSLFEANAYFMLFATRFETGVWIGYAKSWKFGPLKASVEAWIDGNALVGWKPVQFKGSLSLYGSAELSAFGFGIGISVGAAVAVEVPTPYRVYLELQFKLSLPWPLDDIEASLELEWKETIPPPTPIPLSSIGIEHLKVSEKWTLEKEQNYNVKGDGLWYNDSILQQLQNVTEEQSPIVPLDSKISLSFARPMQDKAMIGINPSGVAGKEQSGDYGFEYRLTGVKLEKRSKDSSSSSWETVAERSASDTEKDKEKFWGTWLAIDSPLPASQSNEVSPPPAMTKLLLFGKSPFEYARETIDDTYFDHFVESNPLYGAVLPVPPKKTCITFDALFDPKIFIRNDIHTGLVDIFGRALTIAQYSGVPDTGMSSVLKTCGPTAGPYMSPSGGQSVVPAFIATLPIAFIVFPELVSEVEFLVTRETWATIMLYNGKTKVKEFSIDNLIDTQTTLKFSHEKKTPFNLIVIEGCASILRICYVTANEGNRFEEESHAAEKASHAGEVYCQPPDSELLSPNSFYKLTVQTEARRYLSGSLDKTIGFTESTFFQTENPPGMPKTVGVQSVPPDAGSEHYPSGGPLKDLRPYVQKLTPVEGYPSVYRSYDVGVEFNETYTEQMYRLAGTPLCIYFYDTNNEFLRGPDGQAPVVSNGWKKNLSQSLSRSDAEYVTTLGQTAVRLIAAQADAGGIPTAKAHGNPIGYATVGAITTGCKPPQKGVWAGGEGFLLKARTLYRAALTPMIPAKVIPLTKQGTLLISGGTIVTGQVETGGGNFKNLLDNSFGQAEQGVKLITDGNQLIVSDLHAAQEATPFQVTAELVQQLQRNGVLSSAKPNIPPPVFAWGFITSRYATFVHHIQSFVDAAWNLKETLLNAPSEWPRQSLFESLKTEIEKSLPDASIVYSKAVEFFGLQDRPLPERVEINVLENNGVRYGFYIESPEPILYKIDTRGRVELIVQRSTTPVNAGSIALRELKMIGCDLTAEWIDVLAQDDLDASGYSLQLVSGTGSGNEQHTTYYTFPSGSKYIGGTVIRIYGGAQPTNPPALQEIKALYAGALNRIINLAGQEVLLNNTKGEVIHRKHFLPASAFSAENVFRVSDADGTRSFIFLKKPNGQWNTAVPDGAYKLKFSFDRDAGEALPVLSRFGSTDSEQTEIVFNVPAELP